MDLIRHTPADSTADPSWSAVRVTATLTTPAVGIDTHPMHLDGPASWAAYQAYITRHGHASLPPMTDTHAVDFALPLATWSRDGHWGWACSRAIYDPLGYTTTAMRRRPAADEMARLAPDRKHSLAAGPMKARDTPLPATIVHEITWYALAHPDELRSLLGRVWSIGRLGRHGHGRIRAWTVTEHTDRTAWEDRDWTGPTRAPYHHPTRRR